METQENETAIGLQNISVRLENLESPAESIGKKHFIYKALEKVRQTKVASYSPRIVSIGPFHHGDERLKLMELRKLGYLKGFLQGTRLTFENCISKLKEWELSIQNCYAEIIPFDSDHFLNMILVDAGFIIELFVAPEGNKLFLEPWVAEDVFHDLILLENQLPFFVLEKLFNLAPACYRGSSSFLEHTFDYFKNFNTQNLPHNDVSVQHFTDLLRLFYMPPKNRLPRRTEEGDVLGHLYGATELVKAGLKLKVDKTKKCLLELQYVKGVLIMPCLNVSDEIESHMRNIVAFEQYHYPYETYITDYLKVLGFLVFNKEDVEELLRRGIITSSRDSSEVAPMIKNFCSNLVQPSMNVEYLHIFRRVNEFLEKPVTKWKASMKTISIAAVAILILAIVQTICSVISLFKS